MDRQEPGVDQREQLLTEPKRRKGRTGAEWDELAVKVLLLYPETAKAIMDVPWQDWKNHRRYLSQLTQPPWYADQVVMILGARYEVYPLNRIAKALRNMRREARQSLSSEARNREYRRDKQR